MNTQILKNICLVMGLLLLGGCSTSGMVGSDVNLSLSEVRISRSNQITHEAEFTHLLKEEILYQFSKSNNGSNERKRAVLALELQKLEHPGNQPPNSSKTSSLLAGIGFVKDGITGEKIGEFRLRVHHKDQRYAMSGLPGRDIDNSQLIQIAAQAILKKVYGSARARNIADNRGRYIRQPFVRAPKYRLSRNSSGSADKEKKIGGLRLSLAKGVLPPEFIGPPMENSTDKKEPQVIEAPQLPIQ